MKKAFAAPILLAAAMALMVPAGCGDKDAEGALGPAIVDRADFVGRVDYRSLTAAPVSEYIEKERQKGDLSEKEQKFFERLREGTGLDENDILAILFSGSLDGVDIDSDDTRKNAAALDAALAVTFARPLDDERLRRGLEIIVEEAGGATLNPGELAGRGIYRIQPDNPSDPELYTALANGGRALYAAFNEKSLAAALEREKGQEGGLPKELLAAEKGLPDGSQLTYTFIVPPAMGEQIEAKISDFEAGAVDNPGLGMILGFVAPFKHLSGFSLGVRLSERVDLNLAADLGSDQEAMQAAALIQTMLVPLLKSQLARRGGGAMTDYEDRLTVGSEGRNLNIALQLNQSDLAALNGQ